MANFYESTGNIFDSDAQVLTNPVNCKGTWGRGLALQFGERYPKVLQQYRADCAAGLVTPGSAILYETDGPLVANIATKNDWRHPSRLEWVANGLGSLVAQMDERGLESVAVAALGAGLGGLRWSHVRDVILGTFKPFDFKVTIYVPR